MSLSWLFLLEVQGDALGGFAEGGVENVGGDWATFLGRSAHGCGGTGAGAGGCRR